MEKQPLRATYSNVPDHSDLRGFSYRGPDSEDHPENNERFELSAEGATEAKGGSAPRIQEEEKSGEEEDLQAAEGPQNVDIDENDNEDVLEEVRGGLRADVPDEIEYDDTDANAHRVADQKGAQTKNDRRAG